MEQITVAIDNRNGDGLACYCLLILVIACMTLCRGGRGKDQS